MWIALLDFCIFLLLFGFFLFGLREWDRMLVDQEDGEHSGASGSSEKSTKILWLLIIGFTILSMLSTFKGFF